MKSFLRIACFLSILFPLCLSAGGILQAGVKYEQTTLISGSMIEMMKKMPLVGKKFGGEMRQTSYFTAESSRTDSYENGKLSRTEIILLGAEKFIHIDHERKTYSEQTFAEMKAQLEKSMQEMKKERQGDPEREVTLTPKVSVQDTGETKMINGYQTRHYILTLSMEVQDKKSEQKGTMEMVSDLWNSGEIPGSEEQRDFYRRMAEKMGTMELYRSVSAAMAGMTQDANMAKGMAEMKKEMSKIEGTPVLTVASINMPGMPSGSAHPGDGTQTATASGSQSESVDLNKAAEEAARESANQSASDAAQKNKSVGKVFGKLGGLGGFGGFGKKKKAQPPEETPPPAPEKSETQAATQTAPTTGKAEPFMITTVELKSAEKISPGMEIFSSPAGYQLVKEKE